MLPALQCFGAEWDGLATVGKHYAGLRRWKDGTWTVEVWPVNQAYHRHIVYRGTQFPEDARGVWLQILTTGRIDLGDLATADQEAA